LIIDGAVVGVQVVRSTIAVVIEGGVAVLNGSGVGVGV
jgi:hypothetical protein